MCPGSSRAHIRPIMPLPPASPPHASARGLGLTLPEYAKWCETMGRCISLAPEACNSSAPDTGNMEVLLRCGTPEQRATWLVPLLNGAIRSTFLMTEPRVASSDATNIETSIKREGRYPLS